MSVESCQQLQVELEVEHCRAEEIRRWLQKHAVTAPCVAVDDLDLGPGLAARVPDQVR